MNVHTRSELLRALGLDRLVELAESIERNGYDPEFPVEVDAAGEVVDGRHRTAVCVLLGVEPVRRTVTRTVTYSLRQRKVRQQISGTRGLVSLGASRYLWF
jgi:hypothetical protein